MKHHRTCGLCALLQRVLDELCPAEVSVSLSIGPIVDERKEVLKILDIGMLESQKCLVRVRYKDKTGKPASVDGAPVWSSSDASIATVDADPSGFSAFIHTKPGVTGTVTINITADADLGSGVKAIASEIDVNVLPREAEQVSADFDPPEDE
jgi:hypothetical protein